MLATGVNLSLLVSASINPREGLRMLELGGVWLLLWGHNYGAAVLGVLRRPRGRNG